MNLSQNIYNYLLSLYGEEAANKYDSYVADDPQKYIRVNPLKTSPKYLQKLLKDNYGITSETESRIPNALKILEDADGVLGKTIEHISGLYYIQSLSSMLPPLVLNPSEKEIVLGRTHEKQGDTYIQ